MPNTITQVAEAIIALVNDESPAQFIDFFDSAKYPSIRYLLYKQELVKQLGTFSALQVAEKIIEIIKKNSSDINGKTIVGHNFLHFFILTNNAKAIEALLNAGCNLHQKNMHDETPYDLWLGLDKQKKSYLPSNEVIEMLQTRGFCYEKGFLSKLQKIKNPEIINDARFKKLQSISEKESSSLKPVIFVEKKTPNRALPTKPAIFPKFDTEERKNKKQKKEVTDFFDPYDNSVDETKDVSFVPTASLKTVQTNITEASVKIAKDVHGDQYVQVLFKQRDLMGGRKTDPWVEAVSFQFALSNAGFSDAEKQNKHIYDVLQSDPREYFIKLSLAEYTKIMGPEAVKQLNPEEIPQNFGMPGFH